MTSRIGSGLGAPWPHGSLVIHSCPSHTHINSKITNGTPFSFVDQLFSFTLVKESKGSIKLQGNLKRETEVSRHKWFLVVNSPRMERLRFFFSQRWLHDPIHTLCVTILSHWPGLEAIGLNAARKLEFNFARGMILSQCCTLTWMTADVIDIIHLSQYTIRKCCTSYMHNTNVSPEYN